jgi:hypothetical protein
MLLAAALLAASSVAVRADDGTRIAALQAELAEQRVKLTSSAQDYRAAAEELRTSRVPPDRLASVAASLSSLPADLDRYVSLQKDLGRPGEDAALVTALKSEAALAQDVLKTLSPRGAAALAASPLPEQISKVQVDLSALLAGVDRRFPYLAAAVGDQPKARTVVPGTAYDRGSGALKCAGSFDGRGCSGGGAARQSSSPNRAALAAGTSTRAGTAIVAQGAPSLSAHRSIDRGVVPAPNLDAAGASAARLRAAVPAAAQALTPAAQSCATAVNGPDPNKPQHPTIAGWCANYPTFSPVLAGLLDSIHEQFGTVSGIVGNLAFMLFGLVMSVLTGGVALILKLLMLIGMSWALWSMFKQLLAAISAYRAAKTGSVESFQALKQMGVVGGGVLIMILMGLIGFGAGKLKAGKATANAMESGMRGALTKTGIMGGVESLNAKLPAPMLAMLEKLMGSAPKAPAVEPEMAAAALVVATARGAVKAPAVKPAAVPRAERGPAYAPEPLPKLRAEPVDAARANIGAEALKSAGVDVPPAAQARIAALEAEVAKFNSAYTDGYHGAAHQVGRGSVADLAVRSALPKLEKPAGMSQATFDDVRAKYYIGGLVHDVEGVSVVVQKGGSAFLKYADGTKNNGIDIAKLGAPIEARTLADGSQLRIYPKAPGSRSSLLTSMSTLRDSKALAGANDPLVKYFALKGTAFSPQEKALAAKLLPGLEAKIRAQYGAEADAVLAMSGGLAEKMGAADVFNHYVRGPKEAFKALQSLEHEFGDPKTVNVKGAFGFQKFVVAKDPKLVAGFADLPLAERQNFVRNLVAFKAVQDNPALLARGVDAAVEVAASPRISALLEQHPDWAMKPFDKLVAAVEAVDTKALLAPPTQVLAAAAVAPVAAAAAPKPTTMELLGRFSKMSSAEAERAQTNPAFAKTLIANGLDKTNYATPAAAEFQAAVQRNGAALIMRSMTQWKSSLMEQGQAAAVAAGVKPGEVITHGTTLKGLLGMLVTGGIESTSSYSGMRGEGAHFWGGKGLDVGAGYAAKRGLYDGQPGVLLLMNNPSLKVLADGQTLSRKPMVDGDFVAAVVYDGERSVVLSKEALLAMARSAKTWQTSAVDAAQSGKMREFDAWERIRDRLLPRQN